MHELLEKFYNCFVLKVGFRTNQEVNWEYNWHINEVANKIKKKESQLRTDQCIYYTDCDTEDLKRENLQDQQRISTELMVLRYDFQNLVSEKDAFNELCLK